MWKVREFPLTPALSLGEGENFSQSLGKIDAVNCSKNFGNTNTRQRLCPLPAGEGQGEGNATWKNPAAKFF